MVILDIPGDCIILLIIYVNVMLKILSHIVCLSLKSRFEQSSPNDLYCQFADEF